MMTTMHEHHDIPDCMGAQEFHINGVDGIFVFCDEDDRDAALIFTDRILIQKGVKYEYRIDTVFARMFGDDGWAVTYHRVS